MGELGSAPRAYLNDPHPGVRACAALAPALADDPAALAEILTALADPAAVDDWFTRRPPQFGMHVRFTLIAAAGARVQDPERLLPAALAVAPLAGRHTAWADLGPFLRVLFAGRGPGPLTPTQSRFLAALVDNDDIWTPGLGRIDLTFHDVALPYDRRRCHDLTSATAPASPTA
jgi:hypothetical protein